VWGWQEIKAIRNMQFFNLKVFPTIFLLLSTTDCENAYMENKVLPKFISIHTSPLKIMPGLQRSLGTTTATST